MRLPLIPLTDSLREAARTSTVVTATARQAQELRYAWAFQSCQSGATAWQTPPIMHFNAWLISLYRELANIGHASARRGLLQRSALDLAFRLCAPDDEYHKHTRAVVDAWRIYCEWNLRRVAPDLRQTENGRLFTRWVSSFDQFRDEQEIVTVPELSALLTSAVRTDNYTPKEVTLVGCDELSPSQQELIHELARRNLLQSAARPNSLAGQEAKAIDFESTSREKSGFAAWAREKLSELGENSRIGIVVPDLSTDYLAIRRHLEAMFFDSRSIDQIANIGAGVPLRETRLVQDVLKFLSWTMRDLSYTEVLQLGRSPYLKGLEIPVEFPHYFPDRLRFAGYASRSKSPDSQQITRLTTGRTRLLSDWVNIVHQVLNLAGWTSDDDSTEDQRIQASLVEVLNDVAKLSAFVGRTSWQQAVTLVRDGARSHELAYESRYAPVQVLSRMDSVGLQFDALWVSGLAEDNWPPDANPNPMIPIRVQRKAVMPRVTHQQMLRWAQEMTTMWQQSSNDVVFSCAPKDEQTEIQPSRLVSSHRVESLSEVLDNPQCAAHDHPWGQAKQSDLIREFLADSGSPLPRSEYDRQRSSFLRDQSNCPFRAWAIHRLALREGQQPHRFPDLLDRGTIVHKTFQLLIENARSQSAISNITEKEIEDAIDESVAHLKGFLLPDRFLIFEKTRIRKLVDSWLEFELARKPFKVLEVEGTCSIEIEGIGISLRVDRIDETDDLQALVVDYKTGSVKTTSWRLPRPTEPQMPLYSLAVPGCDGLAYQRIAADPIKHDGIAVAGEHDQGIELAHKKFGTDFEQLKKDWSSSLREIAREFKSGRAVVQPTNPNQICRTCHLMSLCREFADVNVAFEESELPGE